MVFDGKTIDQLACEDDLEDVVIIADDHIVIHKIVEYGNVLVKDAMIGDCSDIKSILPVKRMSVP